MMEIKGVPRKPFDLRVTMRTRAAWPFGSDTSRRCSRSIKAAGGRVLSRNDELVVWSETIRNVFVKDPNGFNLELVGSADPNQ